MTADLLPDGLFVSTAQLPWMAEEGPWLPPPSPRQDQYRLDCGGDRSGRVSLLRLKQSQEHSENTMEKVPKLEQTTSSDLAVAAMGTPSDLDINTRKRLALPLSLPSPAPLLSLGHVPLPLRSVGQRAQRSTARPAPQRPIPPKTPSSMRRKSISERIRPLARLMPWDRKMTTCVLLEEAHKYVKFLEAQVAALQCMPAESRFACPPPSSYAAAAPLFRGLERLTRQQLLHVLVASPMVQDKLCAGGLCVFANEQVMLMRQAAEMNRMLHRHQQQEQQMVLDGGSTSAVRE